MKKWLLRGAFCLALLACKSQKNPLPNGASEVPWAVKEIYYSAENEYQLGNYVSADSLFKEYISKSPKPAPGLYRLACIAKQNSEATIAFQYIQSARKADSTNYYYDIFEAELNKATRNYSTAADIYHNLALRYPSHWSFFDEAARLYSFGKENSKLIAHCASWEKYFGLREEIVQMRTEARIGLSLFDDALLDWQNLIKKYPYRRQYKLNYAAVLTRAGKKEEAAGIYKELLAADGENPDLLSSLCQYYNEQNNTREMWQLCKLVAKSQQMDIWAKNRCIQPFLNNHAGNIYYDSMEDVLLTLTRTNPAEHSPWMFLADWYAAKKVLPKAVDAYQISLGLFGSDYQTWTKYVKCIEATGNYVRMLNAADSMLQVFPNTPEVYNIAAQAAIAAKDWEKGRAYVQSGLSYALDADVIIALKISMAQILNFSGDVSEAYNNMEALKTAYGEAPAIEAEYAFLKAWNNACNETPASCVLMIDKALNAASENIRFLYIKGFVEMKKENYLQSEIALKKAIGLDANGKTYDLLGDVEKLQNKHAEAKQSWQKAWNMGYRTPDLEKKINTIN